MKVLGKTYGENLDFKKLGFTIVSKDGYVEVWHKKSVKQINVIVEVWRNQANVCIGLIDKNGNKETKAHGYYCDKQSQLNFLLKNNVSIAYHLFQYPVGSTFKSDKSKIIQSASISYSRILPDGTEEKMIEYESGKGEVFRHEDYDKWKKEQDILYKKREKERKIKLIEWLSEPLTPPTTKEER